MAAREATFRGVKFWVDGDSRPIGRRNQISEFPYRDEAEFDDFGMASRRFSFNAFTIGKTWDIDRDALIDALEKKGAGELIHPKYGRRNVVVSSCDVSHSSREIGKATFNIEFTEATESAPLIAVDTSAALKLSANNAIDLELPKFENGFSVKNNPIWVAALATDKLETFKKAMDATLRGVSTNSKALNTYSFQIAKFNKSFESLIRNPNNLALAIKSNFGLFAKTIKSPIAAINALFAVSKALPLSAKTGTNPNQVSINNANLLASQVIINAAANAAFIIADYKFQNYEEAQTLRTSVSDNINDVGLNIADYGDYETYENLINIQTAIIKDIDARALFLPRIIKVTVPVLTPAIVLSHKIYGPENLEAKTTELVSRNKIQNPLFIKAGEVLEATLEQ